MPTIPDPDDLVPLAWRRRIYAVSAALVPVLVVAGVVTDSTALLVLGVINAALGFGTATAYSAPPRGL